MDGRLLLLSLILFSACLASCKKEAGRAGRTATLKDRARIQESKVDWSVDVSAVDREEPAALTVYPSLERNPLAHIAAFRSGEEAKTYPYLEGFASLDRSGYSEASFAALDGFCRALEAGKGEDGFMDKGFLYSLSLFKYRVGFSGRRKAVSHVVGMPLSSPEQDGSLQCPVRIVLSDGGLCDIYVYLVKSASDWKINQIEFMKKDGEDGNERRK